MAPAWRRTKVFAAARVYLTAQYCIAFSLNCIMTSRPNIKTRPPVLVQALVGRSAHRARDGRRGTHPTAGPAEAARARAPTATREGRGRALAAPLGAPLSFRGLRIFGRLRISRRASRSRPRRVETVVRPARESGLLSSRPSRIAISITDTARCIANSMRLCRGLSTPRLTLPLSAERETALQARTRRHTPWAASPCRSSSRALSRVARSSRAARRGSDGRRPSSGPPATAGRRPAHRG